MEQKFNIGEGIVRVKCKIDYRGDSKVLWYYHTKLGRVK